MRIFITVYMICLLLAACNPAPNKEPKWSQGVFVESVLTHEQGQLLHSYCETECLYDVRFPVGSKVGRGLFKEFELRSIQ